MRGCCGILLKTVSFIDSGHRIVPEPLTHIQRMSHRFQTIGISSTEFMDEINNSAQLVSVEGYLSRTNLKTRKLSDIVNFFF